MRCGLLLEDEGAEAEAGTGAEEVTNVTSGGSEGFEGLEEK